jgi:hypothetical protein
LIKEKRYKEEGGQDQNPQKLKKIYNMGDQACYDVILASGNWNKVSPKLIRCRETNVVMH